MLDNGIGFFVFKGQTVASYYPTPEMRTSGDVDFYVFKKDWVRAKSLLEKDVKMTDDHSGQHWEFTKDGIPFEMHYHTAVFASGSRQRYWDELIDSYFDDVLDHVEIDGVGVPTLPPTLNAIYLFVRKHPIKDVYLGCWGVATFASNTKSHDDKGRGRPGDCLLQREQDQLQTASV